MARGRNAVREARATLMNGAPPSRVRAFFSRYRTVLRCWVIFMVALEGMHLLLDWSGPSVWDFLDESTARVTCWTLSLLGVAAHADGKVVTSSIFTMRIIRECTAVHPIMIYTAAVLAYPCRWRSKLPGVAAGILSLLLINQVRLVSLCYIGHWYPESFETAHMLVWQSLIIFATVVVWIVWATCLVPGHATRSS